MLSNVREKLIEALWKQYRQDVPHVQLMDTDLQQHLGQNLPKDHFAIIDLPSTKSGIGCLKQLFEMIGFVERGRGYLPEKQNAFLWMVEQDAEKKKVEQVLPQVVIADFNLDALPEAIRVIVQKYASMTQPAPLQAVEEMVKQILTGNVAVIESLIALLTTYFQGRDWPLLSFREFQQVYAFNELLAWVLVFGRRPNHFGISIHLMPTFQHLLQFNQYLEENLKMSLNRIGGIVKGSAEMGLEQSATVGEIVHIRLADGLISLPDGFMEFVWRYPSTELNKKPQNWSDYFTHFVAQNADQVVESLYI